MSCLFRAAVENHVKKYTTLVENSILLVKIKNNFEESGLAWGSNSWRVSYTCHRLAWSPESKWHRVIYQCPHNSRALLKRMVLPRWFFQEIYRAKAQRKERITSWSEKDRRHAGNRLPSEIALRRQHCVENSLTLIPTCIAHLVSFTF